MAFFAVRCERSLPDLKTTDLHDAGGCARETGGTQYVIVVDRFHPLFGGRFKVTLLPFRKSNPQNVFVEFEEGMQLRIPIDSTDLRSSLQAEVSTKLSVQSLNDFLEAYQEVSQACQKARRKKLGTRSRKSRKR